MYSTCSVSAEENERVVNSILQNHSVKLKEINIKNANLTFSLFSLIWEDKIFWFTILLGLTSLKISINVAFNSMYILKNFIPEVLEIIDPPIIVRSRKYNEKLPSILFIRALIKRLFSFVTQ